VAGRVTADPRRIIDDEEFWTRYGGMDFDEAVGQLAAWEYRYNHERFSMALNGRTPMEKLAAILAQSDRNHQHGPDLD
jgi:hypothetical protein